MDISWHSFLLLFLIAWILWIRVHETIRKFPPSCIGLPLVGRIPMIIIRVLLTPRTNFYRELARDGISKGSVWCTFLGMRRVIGLTSYDAIFDALSRQGNEFSWRPRLTDFTISRMIDDTESGDADRVAGIAFSSGEVWREQRRFALSVMRDLGMGKNLTERKIQIEAKCLNEEIKKLVGQPIPPNPVLTKSVLNVICQFVFGYRIGHDDPSFDEFSRLLKAILNEGAASVFIPLLFPALENTCITRFFGKEYIAGEKRLTAIIAEKISQVEEQMTSDGDGNPEHYVEAFLQRQKREDENSTFNRQQLIISVYDLFLAGFETCSTFLNWTLIYLSVYRDWQEALQAEVDEELGSLNDISYIDRLRCHKTMAFIDEIHRHASIVPHNVQHAVSEECFFRGYRIPKDALIIPDIYSVHYDSKLWPEPQRFDPTRFLNEAGEYQPSKFMIAFSIGKRACLGESIARMEIFLFLASILRSFEVDLDDAAKALKNDVFYGGNLDIHAPKNHKVIFYARSI